MVMDFRDIPAIREKFPRVLIFVLMPSKDVEKTRKMLDFLPQMDHFVNFMGQELALEFLNRRSDFRFDSFQRNDKLASLYVLLHAL